MYRLLSKELLGNFINDLMSTETISLDIETDKLDPFTAKIILVQIKLNDQIYILEVSALGEELLKYIVDLLYGSSKLIIIQNAKFDVKILYNHTKILLLNLYDTMIVESLLNKGIGKAFYSLKELVRKYKGIEISKESREEFIDWDFSKPITEDLLQYSATDVLYLEDIYKDQLQQIKNLKLDKTLEIELKLIPVVAKMEYEGILLDREQWLKLEVEAREERERLSKELISSIIEQIKLDDNISALEYIDKLSINVKGKKLRDELLLIKDKTSIRSLLYKYFNLDSYLQLRVCLNHIGIPVTNTNEKTLNKFIDKYPIIDSLVNYRGNTKKVTTYGSNFLENINPTTGKIHAEFPQTGTNSGRFSSNSPNMQNIIKEQKYRSCFIAGPNYKLISLDYNQNEYRLAAATSGETVIIKAYKSGIDIHISTACIALDKAVNEIIKENREYAKTLNYALIFGISDFGLSEQLNISKKEANALRNKVLNRYPVLAAFIESFSNKVLELGYSTTLSGRKRFFEKRVLFDNIYEEIAYIQKQKREGFNHLIQGSAADILKIAMNNIFYKNPFGEDLIIVLTEHDELVVKVKDEIAQEAYNFIEKEMLEAEQQFLGEIPAAVDGHIENFWVK